MCLFPYTFLYTLLGTPGNQSISTELKTWELIMQVSI